MFPIKAAVNYTTLENAKETAKLCNWTNIKKMDGVRYIPVEGIREKEGTFYVGVFAEDGTYLGGL